MQPERSETFRVGFVLFVALLILIGGVLIIGSETLTTTERETFVAFFDDVGGLNAGASVYLRGVAAGTVQEVRLSKPSERGGPIMVLLSLDKQYEALIYRDCEVQIETEGLLGDKLVSIRGGTAEAGTLKPGATLPSKRQPFLTGVAVKGEEIIDEIGRLIGIITKLADSIESGEGSLSRLIKEPTLHDRVQLVLEDLQELIRSYQTLGSDSREAVRNLEGGLQEAIRRFQDRSEAALITLQESVERTSQDIQGAAAELQLLTTELREGNGTLPRLLQEPDLYTELEHAVANVKRAGNELAEILSGVSQGQGTIGGLFRDPSVLKSIEDIINGIQQSGILVNLIGRAERKGRRLRIQEELEAMGGPR